MPPTGMHGPYKKDMHFPMDTVESTQPHLNKRRKLTKHDVGKSGKHSSCPILCALTFRDQRILYNWTYHHQI